MVKSYKCVKGIEGWLLIYESKKEIYLDINDGLIKKASALNLQSSHITATRIDFLTFSLIRKFMKFLHNGFLSKDSCGRLWNITQSMMNLKRVRAFFSYLMKIGGIFNISTIMIFLNLGLSS